MKRDKLYIALAGAALLAYFGYSVVIPKTPTKRVRRGYDEYCVYKTAETTRVTNKCIGGATAYITEYGLYDTNNDGCLDYVRSPRPYPHGPRIILLSQKRKPKVEDQKLYEEIVGGKRCHQADSAKKQ